MKKSTKLWGVIILTVAIMLGQPFSFASAKILTSSNEASTIQSMYTRQITIQVTYAGARFAPDYYLYHRNGWSGQLWLTKSVITDDATVATYAGTVSCTRGICPIANSLVEEK